LLTAGLILAALPALMAFGCYRAGAFVDWRYQWRTRQEAPRYFWFTVSAYLCISVLIALFTLKESLLT